MRIHFIAIGGSAMHNLALALHLKGYKVSGSDDEIFEPAKGRLARYGLIPDREGWFPEKITEDLDAIILGMHARADNPELLQAQELGLKIFSYPEFLYEQSKNKIRVVVGGSHGKTTITAMILHVLQEAGVATDYMVGAKLEGFDVMVKLTDSSKFMVFEGDEYLTSPIDRRPKFHLYRPHIALLSGIAWDHINVFPTFENYIDQFRIFRDLIEPEGCLFYCNEDPVLRDLCNEPTHQLLKIPYEKPSFEIIKGTTFILANGKRYPMNVFGIHNMLNISGARHVCLAMGIEEDFFYEAISSFKGAMNRLECLAKSDTTVIYKDFAHSPSKVKATIIAMKEQYPDRKLVASLELHTYSSLRSDFIEKYSGTLDCADEALVYYNPHALALKKLPPLDPEWVKECFKHPDVKVFNNSSQWKEAVMALQNNLTNFLFMSSGNFDGIILEDLAHSLANQVKN